MSMHKYKPELDGLRAFAIIPVIIFHINPKLFPCGFLGVDIFFVISGYLITSNIHPQLKEGAFSFREFYFRRVKRLLPAIFFLILALQLFGGLILYTPEWKSLSIQAASFFFMAANFYFWWHVGNYWGESADAMPLLHTWSLSVEEQFYLLFPLILQLAVRNKSIRYAPLLATLALASLSYAGFIYAMRNFFPAGFYWGIFRAWEILAGCVLAVVQQSISAAAASCHYRKATRWLPLLGLCLIGVGYLSEWGGQTTNLKNTLLAVVGTCVVIKYIDKNSFIAWSLLTYPIMIYIGVISYSLYLWHWPIIVFFKFIGINSWFAIVTVTAIFSMASFRFIERPFRLCSKSKFIRSFTVLAAMTIISLILPFVLSRPGFRYKVPEFTKSIDLCPTNNNPHFGEFTGSFRNGLSLFQTGKNTADVLILGDSHSIMFFPPIKKCCDDIGLRLTFFGAQAGTSPFCLEEGSSLSNYSADGYWTMEQRKEFDNSRLLFIQKNKPKFIIICSRWSQYNHWGWERFSRHLEKLKSICGNARCVFLGQPPELSFGSEGFTSGVLEELPLRSSRIISDSEKRCDEVHDWLVRFCAANPTCIFHQTKQFFMEGESILYHEKENLFYFDDDHLSTVGAMRIVPMIYKILKGGF